MAAREVKIPERYRAGLARMASLDSQSLEAIVSALASLAPTGSGDRFLVAPLRAALPSLSDDDASLIARSLVGLAVGRNLYELATGVFVTVALDKTPELELGARREEFLQVLVRAIDTSAVSVAAKAIDVAGEHEHLLHDVRILSDVRPVFSDDADLAPTAFLVTHTLKLEYHSAGGISEVYVVLKSGDLTRLTELAARAGTKERSLRTALQPLTNVTIMDGEEEA